MDSHNGLASWTETNQNGSTTTMMDMTLFILLLLSDLRCRLAYHT
jgi:hypothetical protein